MWSQRTQRGVLLAFAFAFGVTLFQNCTNQGFEVSDFASTLASSTSIDDPVDPTNENPVDPGTGALAPGCTSVADCDAQIAAAKAILEKTSPKKTVDCLADNSVNTCLFFKNPVASRGSFFSTFANNSMDLRSYQTLGVQLSTSTYEAATGCLRNSSYRVFTDVTMPTSTTLNAKDACFSNQNFKVPYFNDSTFKFSAVMAHYYLNFQMDFMKEWTGSWYGTNKGTKVFSYLNSASYDNNAAFVANPSDGTGSIIMGGFERGMTPSTAVQESALSAEVYLHEAGHSNVFFAASPIRDPAKNISCGGGRATCCSSLNGCYGAINEGLADYHAMIIFPKNPIIGEAIVNNGNGIVEFGLSRNYNQLKNLTLQQAYEAPNPNTYDGEIHVTGRIWGSIWYEARLAAETKLGIRGVRAIDKLFSTHLAALTGSDDFKTACQKTITLSRTVDSGLVTDVFTAECRRRGL